MPDFENKKLSELRVVDLRAELEKRGLDKSGNKQLLTKRLKLALQDEGFDATTYIFNPIDLKKEEPKAELAKPSEEKEIENKCVKPETPSETNDLSEKSEVIGESESQMNTQEHDADKKELENSLEEDEDPIHLTLDEETLHDVEKETEDKTKEDRAIINGKKETTDLDGTKKEEAMSQKKNEDSIRASAQKQPTRLLAKGNPNVVWVSNIAQNTRACELKAALSNCGKVVGAKIVVSARFPGSNCFGYVIMESAEDAQKVIAKMNNTELNGHMIKIEKFDHARTDQDKNARGRQGTRLERKEENPASDNKKSVRAASTRKDEEKRTEVERARPKSMEKRHSRERKLTNNRDRYSDSHIDRQSKSNGRGFPILTFNQIKEERERQRIREKERILREETRKRNEELSRQKEIEKRQRYEAMRLEREKEKLRIEKEKIAREKAELLRMERERQRIDRETVTREKIELRKSLFQLEENRGQKRPFPRGRDERFDNRKRMAPDRRFMVPPPPPRFEPLNRRNELNTKTNSFGPSKYNYTKPYKRQGSPRRSLSSENRYDRSFESREMRNNNEHGRYFDRERDTNPPNFRNSGRGSDISASSRMESSFSPKYNNSWSSSHETNFGTNWRDITATNERWVMNNSASTSRQFSGRNAGSVYPFPPGVARHSDSRFDYGKSANSTGRKY